MANAIYNFNLPPNEPVKNYSPGSSERKEIETALGELQNKQIEIPLIIGGKEVKTGNMGKCLLPHDHGTVVAEFHKAGKKEVELAITESLKARDAWAAMDWSERTAIFSRAAELLAGPWRQTVNAACMLGLSKTVFQAEIDSACELVDFFKFNSYFASKIIETQPPHNPAGIWNRLQYRALEGFVFAVTPFNFLSIAGNLPAAPALMGNVALWKPASNAVYPAYYIMKLFQEAGLPDGVINFVPGTGREVGPTVMDSPHLAGIHFTGSTDVFQNMWQTVGHNIKNYKSYPRIVGETGGKDFIFAHKEIDVKELGTAMIRGAYEYQGQKCSAASRAYVPKEVWPDLKDFLRDELKTVKMGDVRDFSNFMNAVIDKSAFSDITGYIDYIKKSSDAEIIHGGNYDDSKGYFIEPTLVVTSDPHFKTMEEEIFGPVLTLYLYESEKYAETLKLCNDTSPYALTGAIFSKNREAVNLADRILENAAGNFYINDKPTGAVVGQQPFGGARASGTNDKAGSHLNLLRWANPRTVKENFIPPNDYRYPFMG